MKRLYILMLALLCLAMMTCKKDVEPYVFNAEIKVSDIKAEQVLVEAINDEAGFEKLSAFVYCSTDEKLEESEQYEMTYEDDRFKAYLTELQDGTRYYYKVVFHGKYNSVETEIDTFETEKIELPAVTTMQISDVTTTSAKCGGEVISEGNGIVTARGICWSTSQNPTIEDNKTEDGSGVGSYTSYMTYLEQNTTYYVRAYATNEVGTSYGEEVSFTTLLEKLLPIVTTNEIADITTNSATCGGKVVSDGNGTVTACGICWSTSQNPTIEDNKTEDGSGVGSYTSYMTYLEPNTTYYVRAYATNEVGTAYGDEISFTTLLEKLLPIVTTNEIADITTNSATCGGKVVSDGNGIVTARGVCWSTSQNPTIEDNKTDDGNGIGSYTSYMTYLEQNTTYYVRAYATNEVGTSYGDEISFTTLLEKLLPTVTTNSVTDITTNSATCGGKVVSDGNGAVTARGICWSTSQNPTIEDNKTEDGNGIGSYTSYMTYLEHNTTYYVRAYATNEVGTSYGEEVNFTTLDPANGHEYVDLGLSVKWATCNVGATSPEEYGNYYAWGETSTKANYSSSPTYGLSYSELQSHGYIDSEGNLTPQYDAATVNWGGNWRMPTRKERQELIYDCTWIWTTQNSVKGYKVKGPNGNSIFLPATGFCEGFSLYNAGNYGCYWTSTPNESGSDDAYGLNINSNYQIIEYAYRYYGLSVRPVIE